MNELENAVKDLRKKMYPNHDFVPTYGGRGQHHRRGVVGHIFEVLTKEMALQDYICRKKRQITILEDRLDNCQGRLSEAEKLQDTKEKEEENAK